MTGAIQYILNYVLMKKVCFKNKKSTVEKNLFCPNAISYI